MSFILGAIFGYYLSHILLALGNREEFLEIVRASSPGAGPAVRATLAVVMIIIVPLWALYGLCTRGSKE